MSQGIVKINFTIGFGNNIFQYCFGRLLAEQLGLGLSHRAITELGVPQRSDCFDPTYETIVVDDKNYKKILYSNLRNKNFIINGYFEDYKIFQPHLDKIRGWFNTVEKSNQSDVVLHLRMQNRLIQQSHIKNHISASAFKNALKEFDYENVHIVTDLEKWEEYKREDIEKIQDEIAKGPNPPSNSPWVSTEQSLEYVNHLISGLQGLNPVLHMSGNKTIPGSGGLRGGFMDDFNLIRSFDQIVIHNSTFSWWAAVLGSARKVGIYSPWKIAKPIKERRNLGETRYPGWFSWGSADNLYF